ncbi:hypothetical protein C1X64_04005 [Pseudomonas sp. GW456-E7]|nr:hypothetical protein C1X64_04005 [Pseudomonas sp. GW456-E7]
MWERACSRRGRHIQHRCHLIHRFREQARSHKGVVRNNQRKYLRLKPMLSRSRRPLSCPPP